MRRWLFNLFLSLCLLAGLQVAIASQAKAVSYTYDASKALDYAKAHWNDGIGECAQFVSECVIRGGIKLKKVEKTAIECCEAIEKATGITRQTLTLDPNGYVTKSLNANITIEEGGVILIYCNSHKTAPHIMLIGEFKSDKASYYAHNSNHNNDEFPIKPWIAYEHKGGCEIEGQLIHFENCDHPSYNKDGVCLKCKQEYKIIENNISDAIFYAQKNGVAVHERAYSSAAKYKDTLKKGEEVPVIVSGKNAAGILWYKLSDDENKWVLGSNLAKACEEGRHDYNKNNGYCKKCSKDCPPDFIEQYSTEDNAGSAKCTAKKSVVPVLPRPYQSENKIATISMGESEKVVAKAKNASGQIWYQLASGGWIHNEGLELIVNGKVEAGTFFTGNTESTAPAPGSPLSIDDFTLKLGNSTFNLETQKGDDLERITGKKFSKSVLKTTETTFGGSSNTSISEARLTNKGQTARGLKIGATLAKMKELYGEPQNIIDGDGGYGEWLQYVSNTTVYMYTSDGFLNPIFVCVSKKSNKVATIVFGNIFAA